MEISRELIRKLIWKCGRIRIRSNNTTYFILRFFLVSITASRHDIINPIPANKQRIRTNFEPGKSMFVNPKRAVIIVTIRK